MLFAYCHREYFNRIYVDARLTRQNSAELSTVLLESSVESIASIFALTRFTRPAFFLLAGEPHTSPRRCLRAVLRGYGDSPATANPICC